MTPEVTTMATPEAFSQGTMILFIVLMIRGTIRKGIALWKAGTKKQLARFVCLFIFNTAGILPILYLLFRQTKGKK